MKKKVGKYGSMCLYWKGTLVSTYAVDETDEQKEIDYYYEVGEHMINMSKHIGYDIMKQVAVYFGFLNKIERRKREKLSIYASDHDKFAHSLFALLRLRLIVNDELNGYLLIKKKIKPKNKNRPYQLSP